MPPPNPLFAARPEDFPVQVTEHVRWGDMDAFGHVNNTVFFQLFESARMEFLQQAGFMRLMDDQGIGPILAHTECYFRRPLTYPCDLLVTARTHEVHAQKVVMEYGLFLRNDDSLMAACGTGLVVCYDYNKRCKAQFPEPLRQQLTALRALPL